jgi:ankyrin repeat protein
MSFFRIQHLLDSNDDASCSQIIEELSTLENINLISPSGLSFLHLLIHLDPDKLWLQIFSYLLERKINLELKTLSGETALIYATRRKRYHYIPLLVEHGANTNAEDDHADSALLWCVYSGNLHMVQYLILHGSDPYHNYFNHRNSLMWAVSQNHVQVAKYLFTYFFGDINQEDRFGNTIFTLSDSPEMDEIIVEAVQKSKVIFFSWIYRKRLQENPLMDKNLISHVLSYYVDKK